MIKSIEIDDKDESVFYFDTFEFVIHDNVSYILSDEGYFVIEGLQSFKKISDTEYIIINDNEEKMTISEEDFEKIKDIYLKFS